MISCLGIVFGAGLIVTGSMLTWRSDRVLGLYSRSGWSFDNILPGDGRVTVALGALMAAGIILGFFLRNRAAFAVALAADLATMALAVYELLHLVTRPGVVSPGNGLYMVLGGTVAGGLCTLGAYLMISETLQREESAPAQPVQ